MFAIGIRFLCGWSMATHPANRSQPEWPPHPDRVFMALAAAHFETERDPSERSALEWLEGLQPPSIRASDYEPRKTVTTFVPVNDTASPIKRFGQNRKALDGSAIDTAWKRPSTPAVSSCSSPQRVCLVNLE